MLTRNAGSVRKAPGASVHPVLPVLAVLLAADCLAADLVNVLPVTDRILAVHFDEGHIDYHSYGGDRYSGNRCYWGFLDLARAADKASYTVTSPDDPDYARGRNPLTVGRKSKGMEFNNLYEAPREPKHLSDHYMYIELPTPLKRGRTYTVALKGLAANRNRFTFVFDEKRLRSETVHVNQVGYRPDAKKYAYLSHYMGDFSTATHQQGGLELDAYAGNSFHLVRARDGRIAFSGTIAKRKDRLTRDSESTDYGPHRNFTNADVWECDFSSFDTPGEYRVAVDGIGCSYPFEIEADAYREAFHCAMRGIFFQRSGIVREIEPGVTYPRDFHPDDGVKAFYDAAKKTGFHNAKDMDRSRPVRGIWGWYHDAGDWDTYCGAHSTVPAMLMLLYELAPGNFGDGDVGNRYKLRPSDARWIDEGRNRLPDLLDEVGWYVRFLRRAREAVRKVGGTGGVPGYVGRDGGGGHGGPSWQDKRDVLVAAEDANVTAAYAGLAAWYGACLKKAGERRRAADEWIAEGRAAYDWARGHGASGGPLQFGAVGLYRATGEAEFQSAYAGAYNAGFNPEYWAGPSWELLAACLYCAVPSDHPELDEGRHAAVREKITGAADKFWVTHNLKNRGYRATHITPYEKLLLGTFSTPRMMVVATAHHVTGEAKYLDAVRFAADYCLGGNEMNMVWMSGLGERYDRQPFHIDSWFLFDYDSMVYTNPILPGYVAYGGTSTPDWFGPGFKFVGDEDYSRSTAHPTITGNDAVFPMGEARFENRFNIPSSEFTIHQNQNNAAFTYGYLCAPFAKAYTPNKRPTVTLGLAEGQRVSKGGVTKLTVRCSSDVRSVKYYYDWHFIGESTDKRNGFAFAWDLREYGVKAGEEVLVTAVAYDDRGMISVPTDGGDRKVTVTE